LYAFWPSNAQVAKDTSGAAGGSELVRVNLTITVASLVFDADNGILRVSGKVCKENPHVKKGAFHTLELGPASAHGTSATRGLASVFTIGKDCWDSEFLRRISEASKPASNAEVLGIAMSTSQATICLVTEHMTVVRKTLEPHIPKARGDGVGRKTAMIKYFEQAYVAMKEAAGKRLPSLKLIVLAGPGFTKNEFFTFAMDHVSLHRCLPVAVPPASSPVRRHLLLGL
jgi:protein pelota